MQDVLMFILKNIVTMPDDVKVEETLEQDAVTGGTTNYIVSVNPADVGRVIGKEGKVIKAIRTIMRVMAIQKGVHVRVTVASDNDSMTSSEPVAEVQEVQDNGEISVEI